MKTEDFEKNYFAFEEDLNKVKNRVQFYSIKTAIRHFVLAAMLSPTQLFKIMELYSDTEWISF